MPIRVGRLWECEKGEAAFTSVFAGAALLQEGWNTLPYFLQRTEATGDDRSFALVSASVAEYYLDELMLAFAPGYKDLAERRETTFSLKIEFLKALRLIPPHILQAADIVRRVRNEFAHSMSLDRFEELPPKLREAMRTLVHQLYGDEETPLASMRAMFKALTFVAASGFLFYRLNFSVLREKLDEGQLIEQWRIECAQTLHGIGRESPASGADITPAAASDGTDGKE